jgi:hypothetical protein
MPWTHEKPYVMKLYPWIGNEPEELFHATEADQKQAFERDKHGGRYKRLWRGKGKSPDENEWESLGEWSDD